MSLSTISISGCVGRYASSSSSFPSYTYTTIYSASGGDSMAGESLAMDADGNMYITTNTVSQLLKIAPDLTTMTNVTIVLNYSVATKHRRIYIDSLNRMVENDYDRMYVIPNVQTVGTTAYFLRNSSNNSPVLIYPSSFDFVYFSNGTLSRGPINPTTYALGTTSTIFSAMSNPNILFQVAVQSGAVVFATDRNANTVRRNNYGTSEVIQTSPNSLSSPLGLAFDMFGFMYVAESVTGKIHRVGLNSPVSVVGSTYTYTSNVIATISTPKQMYVNKQNVLFICATPTISSVTYQNVITMNLTSQIYTPGSFFSQTSATSTSTYLSMSGSRTNIGSGNFTIECWARSNTLSNTNQGLFGHGSTGAACLFNTTSDAGKITCQFSGASTLVSTSSIAADTWFHVALVREGSLLRLFVNGVNEGETSAASYTNTNTTLVMFRSSTTTDANYFYGNITLFKMSNIARYSATFTPSTQNYTTDINHVLSYNVPTLAEFLYESSSSVNVTTTNTGGVTYATQVPA